MNRGISITLTLAEALDRCDDWDTFCADTGFDVWAVNEGGGDIEVTLSEAQAIRHGIISPRHKEDYDE